METPKLSPILPNHDKPEAARIGWRLQSTSRPFTSPVNRLRADRLSIPGRGEIQYSYLERGESVIIVPVTVDGQIALIRQYRYPVDQHCLEWPAGCCRDQGGVPLEEVARRELREEIGGTAASLEYVAWFYSSSSLSDEVCHIFLARGVTIDAEHAATEPGEHLELRLIPVAEAVALARGGQIKTGTCALAILWCEERLRPGSAAADPARPTG